MNEQWLPIKGYEGIYSVSDCGRVRRDVTGRHTHAGLILAPIRLNKYGHLKVYLYRNGKQDKRSLHRLVAEHFVPPFKGECVLHNDDRPANNVAGNLRWGTRNDNNQDTIRRGRNPRGSRVGNAKLCESDVSDIKQRLRNGETQVSVAKRYNVHHTLVWQIAHGKWWRHVA